MISLREYSRRRGCSLAAVQKAILTGRLSQAVGRDAKGRPKITDATLADREWRESTAPAHAPAAMASQTDVAAPAATRRSTPDAHAESTLAASRARRERAQAELAELKLAKQRGELVLAEGVRLALVNAFTLCRTKLLGVPSRFKALRPHLAHDDLAALEHLIREALEDLADSSGDEHQ